MSIYNFSKIDDLVCKINNSIAVIHFLAIYILLMYLISVNQLYYIDILIISIINIGIAYNLLELCASCMIRLKDLNKLDKLDSNPCVALLYVTYNDAIPENIERLKCQTYDKCEIFILDDSDNESIQNSLNKSNLKIVRRKSRDGFKAGALNNWLDKHGRDFDYFIIIDSDSVIQSDFVEEMLKYSEHKNNKNIAIFQSKLVNLNNDNEFARLISLSKHLSNYSRLRMGNKFSMVLSQGHNNMHRTKPIQYIGGFSEKFTSEDYATSINLLNKNYNVKMVDVESFETTPETIKGYIKRNLRWSRQNIHLMRMFKDMSNNVRLFLFIKIYNSFIFVVYFALFFRLCLGFCVLSIYKSIIYLILIYALLILFGRPKLILSKSYSYNDYYKYLALNALTNFYILIRLVKKGFTNEPDFIVTDKKTYNYSIINMIREFKIDNTILILLGTLNIFLILYSVLSNFV